MDGELWLYYFTLGCWKETELEIGVAEQMGIKFKSTS